MNSLVLLLIGAILFLIAYTTYGAYLAKSWGIDPSRKTPAHTMRDDIDYCPSNANVLLGHHFSSIAGAGPITGPIQAAIFGWLPVYLWIVVGSIFFGGVHDWGALFASVRHKGSSIGEIIRENLGQKAKTLFNIYAWLTIILIVAAFTDICAGTFAYDPATGDLTGARAGTASVLFIILAMAFGYLVYRKGANLAISSIFGVALLFFCIYLGYTFPFIKLSKMGWNIILIIYICAASTLPVWLLLQPRDYLCSYLLYAMLIGGFLGVIIVRPDMVINASNGFAVVSGNSTSYLFPILFVTVACGAISGFHSLVGSGTSSKQVDNEKDTKLIGYGGMLIEGLVAILALISVGAFQGASGTPAAIFSSGIATLMSSFGIPVEVGKVFIILAFSAFALTSLDTATRIGRYVFQEFFDKADGTSTKSIGSNMYVATLVTVGASCILLMYGYTKIWPIFGSANQLLAGLALLAVTVWLANSGKNYKMTLIPMIFMFAVTLSALYLLIRNFLKAGNIILCVIAVLLFILAIVLIYTAATIMKNRKSKDLSA
ncbi:carbon starvation CstA family protein [Lutispora thermophila]|uniref:Carbon starvation protein n=1 Tax=Lutispora thermophila DSM 19022 TaxID=1122184 RepID=A0A1M6DJL8_9FIRM|nr:carbon starvation protein A [Lutispora thermophila]SHI73405.1 carbon starvation protein [Lutispora thermophila DSM 19022]